MWKSFARIQTGNIFTAENKRNPFLHSKHSDASHTDRSMFVPCVQGTRFAPIHGFRASMELRTQKRDKAKVVPTASSGRPKRSSTNRTTASQDSESKRSKKAHVADVSAVRTNEATASDEGAHYYLVKDEIELSQLENKPMIPWEGVRNYQARNNLIKMKKGDMAFFYQSSSKSPAILAVLKVVKEAVPDPTQFDPNSKYFETKTSPENPRWFMVVFEWVRKLSRPISLAEIKEIANDSNPLHDMVLLRNSRLSVQPVTSQQWDFVMKLEHETE